MPGCPLGFSGNCTRTGSVDGSAFSYNRPQGQGKASKNVASGWQPAPDRRPGQAHGSHAVVFRRFSGFTLIESVVALVIIGIAGAALLSAFITPVANSADPQLIAQARAVGTAYLDEILLRDFGSGPGDCNGASRSQFDTIWCYDGLNESPTDQFGNTIAALTDYRVTTTVSGNASQAAIVVRVQHDSGIADITLESRRGNF